MMLPSPPTATPHGRLKDAAVPQPSAVIVATASESRDSAIGRDLADTVVVFVGDDDIAAHVNCDAGRAGRVERPRAREDQQQIPHVRSFDILTSRPTRLRAPLLGLALR